MERTVRSIVRLKAIDYNSPKHERKEFVYYEEDWTANDWLGIPIDPFGGHIEGRFSEALYSANSMREQANLSAMSIQESGTDITYPGVRRTLTK